MLIYESTKSGFLDDTLTDQLVPEIKRGYESKGLGIGSESEVRSWENSFQYMYKVLSGSELPNDAGVAIEFKIPLTSRRIDFLISGYDEDGNANVAVVELKQWDGTSTETVVDKDGIVKTFLGGGIRETAHPSYQAVSYAQLLRDFNTSIQEKPIHLYPAAYLHNFKPQYRETIDNQIYQPYTEQAPLYIRGDAKKLRSFLETQIDVGDDRETLYELSEGELRPAKTLQDSLLAMLEEQDEFTLIDSQKVVFEKAVELAMRSQRDGQKRVLIVEGGPGTGKTVVAINILAELIQHDLVAQYVSKNRAPREVYKEKLRGDKLVKEIEHLFTGAGSYVETEADTLPALIADEAHRLNAESTFFGRGENQIMEIINAAKFSVFFIDESQRIHIDDIGSKDEIRKHARDLGAEVEELTLESQFRCNGSEGYLAWLDDVLEIRATANADGFDLDYDLRVFDDPQTLHETIARRNEETRLSRVVAGYCWEWDKEGRSDPEAPDITIGDYERSWNLDTSEPWAIAEGSIDEVGCIHTCQGLEFDYVGVIIGEDLKYRDGEIVVDHEARASTDRSLFGIKKMFDEQPSFPKGGPSRAVAMLQSRAVCPYDPSRVRGEDRLAKRASSNSRSSAHSNVVAAKWDNEAIIGHRTAVALDSRSLGKLLLSQYVGKLLKSYHIKTPIVMETDAATTSPKLEVQYSTEYSDPEKQSVPWSCAHEYDLSDLRNELDEYLVNVLNCAGVTI